MKREVTLYEILEVSPCASALVIKAAYRSLAQFNHPDKNSDTDAASERQAQINYAYSVLSDPDKRRRYDQTMESPERLIERRCSDTAALGRSGSMVADHLVSRPFVFRPFT